MGEPGEELRHAHGERGGAGRAVKQGLFTHRLRKLFHLSHGGWIARGGDSLDGDRGIALDVHAEVHGGIQRAGSDQGHDGHQRFEAHRAIANGPGVGLTRDQLRSGAAGDERVKAGDGSAGDGDETERKKLARKNQAGTVDESRHRRHPQYGSKAKHPEGEGENRPELHKSAQVVARGQQQPHRQDARGQTVEDDGPSDRFFRKSERPSPGPAGVDELPTPYGQQQQPNTDGRDFHHPAHPPKSQIAAHEHGDGNGCAHGEYPPGTLRQRLDDHQSQNRQQDNHDGQNRRHADDARSGVQFLLHHLGERLAVAAHRTEQDDEILHRSPQHHPNQNPQRPGQVTELGRQHRADQRSGPRDGREMMAEHNPFVRLDVVPTVLVDLAGRGPSVVEREHARADPLRVEPIADGVGTERRQQEIHRVDRLAPTPGQGGISPGPTRSHREPEQGRKNFCHRTARLNGRGPWTRSSSPPAPARRRQRRCRW